MRLYRDSDTTTKVQWCFCPQDTPVLPFYTRFGSGNWASQKTGWTGPGEVEGSPRPWRDGTKCCCPVEVTRPFGTPQQFAEGAKSTDQTITIEECNNAVNVTMTMLVAFTDRDAISSAETATMSVALGFVPDPA